MFNPIDLSGRRFLVTGASSGIGRATAVLLSRLGASLVLTGRNQEQLEATHALLEHGSHHRSPIDLSVTGTIEGWMDKLVKDHGPLNGLVHSAGLYTVRPLRVFDLGEFHEVMNLNVAAALALAKGFRKKQARTERGSIVFLASVMGIVGQPGLATYCASKGAIMALTRALALEFASEGIRVNAVAPGQVTTELTNRQFATLSAEQIERIAKMHPLGFGTADDVAHPIAFLLSDAARLDDRDDSHGGWRIHGPLTVIFGPNQIALLRTKQMTIPIVTGHLKVFVDQPHAFIDSATGRAGTTDQNPDSKERWLIVGAGGFGREVYSWTLGQLLSDRPGSSIGFLDDNSTCLDNFPKLKSLWVERISDYSPQSGDRLLMAIADPTAKLKVGTMLTDRGAIFASYIHPTAVVAHDTLIGAGCILCPNAVACCNVRLGDFVTMNIGALVGHDCVVSDGCTLSPHADVLGQAELERGVFLGCQTVILPKTKIGEFARIGAGSVVIGNVRPFSTMMGAPAKRISWSKSEDDSEQLAG